MIGLVEIATGELVAIVDSTVGYDMALYTTINVAGDPAEVRWDRATQQLVPRPLTAREVAHAELIADARWQAIQAATPAQIEAWLTSNVTDLASARRVLKLLILALRALKDR